MKIAFLLTWAYGMGGLVRTTVNTANYFAEQGHDVELITFWRHSDEPFFEVRPDVRIRTLVDIRPGAKQGRVERWARSRPSLVIPESEPFAGDVTLYGDYLLWRTLRSLDADVLISTRPAWNLAAAMWAPEHTLTIGEDHLNFTKHRKALRWQMRHWYPRLDAMVTLTEADRADYQKLLHGSSTTVRAIGNAVSSGPHPRSAQTEPVVVTAGRFVGQKRFDHLIRAFAVVAQRRPDWSLRIFGSGQDKASLQALITELNVGDNVRLMGRTTDTEAEFAKASIMAMSSRYEGYPMVILEAFACGLPVVSYECPRGPAEMITDGVDGLLVKNGAIDELAEALLALMDDPDTRHTMSKNALATAERAGIDHVGAQWFQLFDELRASRGRRPGRPITLAVKRRILEHRSRRVRWT